MNGSITWVDRAGSVCRVEFQPGFTWSEPARHNMIPVDRAGPVCRDEIQPAFTWSGPAGDVCACFILQNSPFLRQKSENRGFWASFDARSWNGRTGRGEKGNGERGGRMAGRATPSSTRSPISRPRVKTRSKTPIFGLLAKEGAVLQSKLALALCFCWLGSWYCTAEIPVSRASPVIM